MSKLTEYIQKIKNEINKNSEMTELKIMRYIYMDLGKKMDFDLNYTFGNRKEKTKIYEKSIDEDEMNRIFEAHTSICKGISYLYAYILNEVGINATVARETSQYFDRQGKHMYNIVTLKDGIKCIADLEDDLEYIQSGAKTRKFGNDIYEDKPIFSDDELRECDMKNGYIPEGYYLEDMVDMLKVAVTNENISLEQRLEFVLENLNVYKDNTKVKYREMVRYQERMLEEMFSKSDLRKIHLINMYENIENEKEYKTCIILDKSQAKNVYLFSNEKYKYNKISIDELVNKMNNGMVAMEKIPGLKKHINSKKEKDSYER